MQTANKPEAANVKFRFKNLGPVKEAELELGDLTIIAGRNNTGKTYMVYTLYGYLKTWRELLLQKDDSLLRHSLKVASVTLEDLIHEVITEGQARWKVDRDTLDKERARVIQELAQEYSKRGLPRVFNSPQETFETASIETEFSSEFLEYRRYNIDFRTGRVISMEYNGSEIVVSYQSSQSERDTPVEILSLRGLIPSIYLLFLVRGIAELERVPFILSAERFFISLFYKELDFTRSEVVRLLQQMEDAKDWESSFPSLLTDRTSRYALPIKDNIDFTRNISDHSRKKSGFSEGNSFEEIVDMLGGYFESTDDDIRFISKKNNDSSFDMPLHLASSSARGLSDLYFFLRYVAHGRHLLIIDEPESHLDTANQMQFARVMAKLVRAGVKVLITTHSDYLIKEINNLIMLSKTFKNKENVIKRHRYKSDDFISPDSIRAYVAEGHTLTPCTINQFGIEMPVFDKTIDDINRASNDLASRLIIEEEEE